jgi:hypothetical protein
MMEFDRKFLVSGTAHAVLGLSSIGVLLGMLPTRFTVIRTPAGKV